MYDSLAEQGACFIFVEGADPEALKGIDPAKPMTAATARNSQCRVFRHGLDFNINPWCIAGAPVAAWARMVFPGLSDEAACYRLWQAILDASRALGEDPCADWELHNATFEKNLRMLNEAHFDRLRYTAANGTDLVVGLTKKHVWDGGKTETPEGRAFFPNIPTEEVFTSPKSKAAKKLVFQGEKKTAFMTSKRCIRIVFTENSSFEPVIANMVLECRASVNILLADTQDVGGIARGQMILQLPEETQTAEKMIQYLKDRKLTVEELDDYVE